MRLEQLLTIFRRLGVRTVLCKPLAANDNSKQQIYLGPDASILNTLPCTAVTPTTTARGPMFKAALNFWWVNRAGESASAPGAQLILYPQYPEVRMSGFLTGCRLAPSATMTNRRPGRLLFFGLADNTRIYGFVTDPDTALAREFNEHAEFEQSGVFRKAPLILGAGGTSRGRLIGELRRIHLKGWIDSKRLRGDGGIVPCAAPNCGGYTLEAELGITPNGDAEPDFEDWEVKQHAVTSFANPASGRITLMTPEPTGGVYHDDGVAVFIRRFGYPDDSGIPDRLNFGGVYRFGVANAHTGLILNLEGYEPTAKQIVDAEGAITLRDANGTLAASWNFPGLFRHWSRKHAFAVYVPSRRRTDPVWQYCYGDIVRLAESTDPLRLLGAIAEGRVFYDPGIKMEAASGPHPVIKRRSQFRIQFTHIASLYRTVSAQSVLDEGAA